MNWESIGKITKTHGLKGELKFHPSIDEPWIVGLKKVRLSFKNALEVYADYDIRSKKGCRRDQYSYTPSSKGLDQDNQLCS